MDLTVEQYIDGLLNEEAHKRPSDNGNIEDLERKMQLPKWFDEDLYNQGRRFIKDFFFPFNFNMTLGLTAIFAVPSILKILVSTRRSNSVYTSYRRYISTLMHIITWFEYELKPGTKAWRSLQTVRIRHFQAGLASSLKGHGIISQRDMALTQFGFIGFAILKPDKFSIRQIREGDWEGYNHFWRTLGHMIGLEDRYNLCRKNIDETREACRVTLERVFTPCLENVPEYFEHIARVMLEGLCLLNDKLDPISIIFRTKYYADVPGYLYTEDERIAFQNKLKKKLNGKLDYIGVDTADLMSKCAVDGLPNLPPRLLYIRDFDAVETTPAYKQLNFAARYHYAFINLMIALYNTDIGRYVINLLYRWNIFISFFVPYKAFIKFRFKYCFVDMFAEDQKDDTEPIPNADYEKPPPPDTWFGKLCTVLW